VHFWHIGQVDKRGIPVFGTKMHVNNPNFETKIYKINPNFTPKR
jgi:hypothetical protein